MTNVPHGSLARKKGWLKDSGRQLKGKKASEPLMVISYIPHVSSWPFLDTGWLSIWSQSQLRVRFFFFLSARTLWFPQPACKRSTFLWPTRSAEGRTEGRTRRQRAEEPSGRPVGTRKDEVAVERKNIDLNWPFRVSNHGCMHVGKITTYARQSLHSKCSPLRRAEIRCWKPKTQLTYFSLLVRCLHNSLKGYKRV